MSADGLVLGLGAGSAERAYRRALRAYPRRYRRERGEEIISTLLDAADQGGAGADDGAAPARADRREVAALVAGGLRRRLHPENPWWDGVRWAGVIMISFVVLRATASLMPGLRRGVGDGWLFPHGLDDLGWWLDSPLGTMLVGSAALVGLVQGWRWMSWSTCATICAARVAFLFQHDRASAGLVLALVAVWAAGPLALQVAGSRRRGRSALWAATIVVLSLGLPAWSPRFAAPELLLLAALAAAAVVVVPICRGLSVACMLLVVLAACGGAPGGVAGEALLAAVVSAGWAELLHRVVQPRLPRGRGGAAAA